MGLDDSEFLAIENSYSFQFPPDLREFLPYGMPVSPNFPNWRTGECLKGSLPVALVELMDWPAKGVCFDVEHHGFWIQQWGPKPSDTAEALRVARERVKQAPALIPVWGHRFLPAEPVEMGNPVLSVWQTDIIYYGSNLISCLRREFKLSSRRQGNGNSSAR